MQISKKSQYGLRAMVYLARFSGDKKLYPLKEISRSEGIPFDFLEKIISKLEKAGLVRAKRGFQGGYFLAKNPRKITVGEIVGTLEGTIPVSCSGCGRIKKCLARNVWKKVEHSLNSTLNSITLANLIKK